MLSSVKFKQQIWIPRFLYHKFIWIHFCCSSFALYMFEVSVSLLDYWVSLMCMCVCVHVCSHMHLWMTFCHVQFFVVARPVFEKEILIFVWIGCFHRPLQTKTGIYWLFWCRHIMLNFDSVVLTKLSVWSRFMWLTLLGNCERDQCSGSIKMEFLNWMLKDCSPWGSEGIMQCLHPLQNSLKPPYFLGWNMWIDMIFTLPHSLVDSVQRSVWKCNCILKINV